MGRNDGRKGGRASEVTGNKEGSDKSRKGEERVGAL